LSGLKQALLTEARAAGFAKMGVCRPDAIPEAADRLAEFVAAGRHGQMGWMAERMGWRGNPAALWPEARSVIMLAEVYTPDADPLEVLDRRDRATISVYAQNRDYHDLVKKRLKRVGRWLLDRTARDADAAIKGPFPSTPRTKTTTMCSKNG
jgi:epoxyqueuosine reductase